MRGPGGCGEIVPRNNQHRGGSGGEKVETSGDFRRNWGPWGFKIPFCIEATSREKRSNP